jgi:methylenetetrahydrofolate dehydrogenase (NADP+)/methenyltetrahydrofolate cyclohydrolase
VTAKLIDGRAMGREMRSELRYEVRRYVEKFGKAPGLVIVRVGGDAASGVYSKAILRIADEIGVNAALEQLPEQATAEELRALLTCLNHDKAIHGIIVQTPLPAHLPQQLVAESLAPAKDIDGISLLNAGHLLLGTPGLVSSTAAAVMELLERIHLPLEGKHAVIIGRSNVVGKPLALLLLQKNATVTICHSRTANLSALTRQADILVAAVGRPRMVTAEMVRPGAVVLDVGINALPEGGIVGDVDMDSVKEVASLLTPTPGGVGPLTNVMLFKQCVQAAWQQAGCEKK